jgi:hypothetical protein
MWAIRPVYAFYDNTHVHLTKKAIEILCSSNKGYNYSCAKELEKFTGKEFYDGKPESGKQGIVWGSIAEDYFGENWDYDTAIVKHHYYDPVTRGALSDFEGYDDIKERIPVGSVLAPIIFYYMARGRTSAPYRAQKWVEAAYKAYNHGSIRDAYSLLGRAVHLLEDMGCPAHARNDNHLGVYDSGLINDHLMWDTLEQFCEGRNSEYAEYLELSNETDEIKKYFPFNRRTGKEFQKLSKIKINPYEQYIKNRKDILLSPIEFDGENGKIIDVNSVEEYIEEFALDTAEKWLSDDTIPGNRTKPLFNPPQRPIGAGYKGEGLPSDGVLDIWMELNLNEDEIEENMRLESWLYNNFPEIQKELSLNYHILSKQDAKSLFSVKNPHAAAWADAMRRQAPMNDGVKTTSLTEEVSVKLWESYRKWDFHALFNETKKNPHDAIKTEYSTPFILLWRRRYRLKQDYLKEIIEDRFPLVVKKAASLIQCFYDMVQHVEISLPKKEPCTGPMIIDETLMRKLPLLSEKNEFDGWEFNLQIHNCGALKDDITLDIEGIPEEWTFNVEVVKGLKDQKIVQEEIINGVWSGVLREVEPTPGDVAEQEGISSDKSPQTFIEEYSTPFIGERGAELKITIKPPER